MKRRSSPSKSQETGQFRIIAGNNRGRKLTFPAVEHLRPTPDRVRETLFSWLFDDCPNSQCLDLFAGAGSLGLEALSRGARHCTFIEQNSEAVKSIRHHCETLTFNNTKVIQGSLPTPIKQLSTAFNLIFIDPPYQHDITLECINHLLENELIADNAWIYIENASSNAPHQLASNFSLHREKIFGQVRSSLFQHQQIS